VKNDIPLVWVELGRKVPKYALANIFLHNELHPEISQILISDHEPPKSIKRICNHVSTEDINDIGDNYNLIKNINRNTSQIDFWLNTTRRFMILGLFMNQEKMSRLIHSESDNITLDFTSIFTLFSKTDWGIAYPMQSHGVGCASILLINNLEYINLLNSFILENWQELNVDDMKLLGAFSASEGYIPLPTYPFGDYVYDAGTYGKYLLGADARNFRLPRSRRGLIDNSKGAINPIKEGFSFNVGPTEAQVRIEANGRESILVNLHVHSKKISSSATNLLDDLSKSFNSIGEEYWERGDWDWIVIVERLFSSFNKRVLRRKREIRLR